MNISFSPKSLKETTWSENAVRFLLGGLICVAAGLTAKKFGPAVGGLMLAFPAIFPAGATLIESHQKRKKAATGRSGVVSGRQAAALDASGSVSGAFALAAFAAVLWHLLPRFRAGLVLTGAALLWLAVSVSLWWLQKRLTHR